MRFAQVISVHSVSESHLHSSQFENNHLTEMCIGSDAGSYLRLIDSCITQLQAQGPSRTCIESKEEEEEERHLRRGLWLEIQ